MLKCPATYSLGKSWYTRSSVCFCFLTWSWSYYCDTVLCICRVISPMVHWSDSAQLVHWSHQSAMGCRNYGQSLREGLNWAIHVVKSLNLYVPCSTKTILAYACNGLLIMPCPMCRGTSPSTINYSVQLIIPGSVSFD